MALIQYCFNCGAKIHDDSQFCDKCGAKIKTKKSSTYEHASNQSSKKSGRTALLLCIFFGIFGAHRFYVGKIGSGIFNLLTGGLLGIWAIIDLIYLTQNKFTDAKGNDLIVTKNLSLKYTLILTISSLIFWIIITLSVLFTFIYYLTNGLINTANAQLEAMRQGRIEQAYSYTSQQYQQAISFENFKKWMHEYPEFQNNKIITFEQSGITHSRVDNIQGYLNSGFLEGTITTNDGKKLKIKYIFLKEHGIWKILEIVPESK